MKIKPLGYQPVLAGGPSMLGTRIIDSGEIKKVRIFYQVSAYSQPLDPSDSILVAESDGDILAALRLCYEYGTLVLRGMRVHPDYVRQGIGSYLLQFASDVIGDEPCYCIPYRYLSSFYGQIGFREISVDDAPAFLRARLKKYKDELNLDVILMESGVRRHWKLSQPRDMKNG